MKETILKLKKQGYSHRAIAKKLNLKSANSVTQALWKKLRITKKARGIEIWMDTGEECTLKQIKILEKIIKLMEDF